MQYESHKSVAGDVPCEMRKQGSIHRESITLTGVIMDPYKLPAFGKKIMKSSHLPCCVGGQLFVYLV